MFSRTDIGGYSFVRQRKDLNFAKWNGTGTLTDICDALYSSTVRGNLGDTHISWQMYWFDYPVTPTLLADCYLYIPEKGNVSFSGDEIKIRDFIKYLNNGYSLNTFFRDDDLVRLRIPYDTYYLWMRLCGWQKQTFAVDIWDVKNNLTSAGDNEAFTKRGFGSSRGHTWRVASPETSIKSYLEFNLAEPESVIRGVPSRSTPIKKKLCITAVNLNQTLRD